MNFVRNKKYFFQVKFTGQILIIILGAIMLFAPGVGKVFGIILIALGAYLIYAKIKGQPTDAEIDEIYAKEMEVGLQRALGKLGVDEDEVKLIDPIVIAGPSHKTISTPVWHKHGKDGFWRSSNYETVILYFSEKQVYCYTYRFSIIGNEKNESTDEYFYKDIVSVSTSSENKEFRNANGRIQPVKYEEFKLTTSGGTSITCTIKDAGSVEKSIQGMKQLLREKKGA
ncbi:hypothetical protein [Gorillibacterium massiliense]|uniref:hypothetical protein n=1 Tax=Gorillibacterium massiliense TaxID=1280390 RepID=UPI0004B65CB9|nr:hypothetical protein [Gorillibacterium massiliense]